MEKNEGWVLFSLEPQLMQRRNSLSDLFLTFSNTPISPSPNPPLDSCVSTLLCWGCLLYNYFNNFASIPGIKSSWIVGVQALGRTGQKCPLVNSKEPLTTTQLNCHHNSINHRFIVPIGQGRHLKVQLEFGRPLNMKTWFQNAQDLRPGWRITAGQWQLRRHRNVHLLKLG